LRFCALGSGVEFCGCPMIVDDAGALLKKLI